MTYRPSDLRLFLEDLGVRPNKRLSQNFLIDGNIIRKIISFAGVQAGDHVLEIGPGPGALTQALLETGAYVTAIEKDPTFATALERLQTPDQRLIVLKQDALECDFSTLFSKKAKVVANLPYHITTPILAKLLPLHESFESLVVMIQKEVGIRFVAPCGTKDYSSFSIFLQFYSQPDYGFTVEPTCFFPRPSVKSAVVKLSLKKPPYVSSTDNFFKLTRTAFQQRRKMLRASLKELYGSDAVEKALVQLGKDPQIRPEELSLENFLNLFSILEGVPQ